MERNLLVKEIDDLSSVRQYFWRFPTIPAKMYGKKFSFSDKAKMVKQILADCATELSLWKNKKETDAGMYDIVKGYWVNGVGVGSSEASTIIKERKADVTSKAKEIRHPWSAAFVSFIIRKAYPYFKKSRAHNRYIAWAKENRVTDAHPFQAYRVDEVAVEPGDIICFARSKKNWATYDSVKGKLTHGDIVTSVQNGYATTVGGNVNKNVEEKTNKYKLDSRGYLVQEYVTVKKKSLPKYIAIIKMLPYYERAYTLANNDEATEDELNRELALSNCTSKEWETIKNGFTNVSWDITPKRNDKESDEEYETRKTEFIDRIHGVLKRAGKNPTDWFNNFTKITFLGIRINNPIHIELATHLTLVEKEFAKKYGSAAKAATALGLSQTISGGRGESSTASVSMHTFGLAIDLEIDNNPYLGGKISFNKKMMNKLKKDIYILDKAPAKPAKMDALDVIFKRAGILIDGKETQYPRNYSYENRLDLYDQLKILSELTVKYFNMVDNVTELTSLLTTNNLKEWKGKSVDDAILLIKKDFDWFRALVARYQKTTWIRKGKKKEKKIVPDMLIKEKGFLNLDRRLVDDLGLDWGAKYGDIMHFDMRNKCVGQKIHSKIR